MWVSLLLFLAGLSAISAQEDLQGKAFIFPRDDINAYVSVKPAHEEPLQNFTVCLRSVTNLIQDYVLFTYATRDQDRGIAIYKRYLDKDPQYVVSIGGKEVYFTVPDSFTRCITSCLTWESETGVIALWIGGFDLARTVVQKGYRIGANPLVVLGVFWPLWGVTRPYSDVSFGGEIKDVYMWNVTFPAKDLRTTPWDSLSPPPIINWRNLQYEIKGNVALV